jgi:hypothetical protein
VSAGVEGKYGMVFLPSPHKYTDNIISVAKSLKACAQLTVNNKNLPLFLGARDASHTFCFFKLFSDIQINPNPNCFIAITKATACG